VLEHYVYTNEKLREIESGRTLCSHAAAQPQGKPALAPLARPVGRLLHRFGHRLESWGASPGDSEVRDLRLRRRTR